MPKFSFSDGVMTSDTPIVVNSFTDEENNLLIQMLRHAVDRLEKVAKTIEVDGDLYHDEKERARIAASEAILSQRSKMFLLLRRLENGIQLAPGHWECTEEEVHDFQGRFVD